MGSADPGAYASSRITLRNEFATIQLTLEHTRCGSRLLVEDRETGAATYLDPLELAGLCSWPEDRRAELLRTGIYAYDDIQEGTEHGRR